MRSYAIILLVATILLGARTAQAQQREWTAKSGQKVVATVEGLNAETVTLQIAKRPAPVRVPIDQLVPADQVFLKGKWFDQQDKRQYDLVVEHLRSIHDRPKTVERLLLEIHNSIPESPYAGLWAAVALSAGSNEYSRAAVLLKQLIGRIEKQQEVDGWI